MRRLHCASGAYEQEFRNPQIDKVPKTKTGATKLTITFSFNYNTLQNEKIRKKLYLDARKIGYNCILNNKKDANAVSN